MGRYFGKVGYAVSSERMTSDVPPKHTGIFEDTITEIDYYGDVISYNSRWQATDRVNDDLKMNVSISIIADEFANQNFSQIKYAEFMGVKWKVETVTPQRPRLILQLGGEYNGPTN